MAQEYLQSNGRRQPVPSPTRPTAISGAANSHIATVGPMAVTSLESLARTRPPGVGGDGRRHRSGRYLRVARVLGRGATSMSLSLLARHASTAPRCKRHARRTSCRTSRLNFCHVARRRVAPAELDGLAAVYTPLSATRNCRARCSSVVVLVGAGQGLLLRSETPSTGLFRQPRRSLARTRTSSPVVHW